MSSSIPLLHIKYIADNIFCATMSVIGIIFGFVENLLKNYEEAAKLYIKQYK